MQTLSDIRIQTNGVGAVLEPEDFGELTATEAGCAELQALLDKHRVLHVKPRAPLTREAVGRFAYALGYPRDPAQRPQRRPDGQTGPAGEFDFIVDLGARADPAPRADAAAREPSYIERLHYDGVSAYSVAATFLSSPLVPQRFVDMGAAWRTLPKALKAVAKTGYALHAGMASPRARYSELPAFDPDTASRRPLVVKHFRTGEPVLHLPRNPASRIEGLDEAEGRAVLDELWAHVEASPGSHAATPQHNEMVVWDGMGAVHSNPPYPRDRDRSVWFFIIPTRLPALEPAFA